MKEIQRPAEAWFKSIPSNAMGHEHSIRHQLKSSAMRLCALPWKAVKGKKKRMCRKFFGNNWYESLQPTSTAN